MFALLPHIRGTHSARGTRWLATVGLDNVKELAKPKTKTLRRRRSFDPSDNPFLANAFGSGGGMSAAENQIKSFMKEGGFEHLEGTGQPLPERNQGHFVNRDEQVLNDIVQRLTQERDQLEADDKAVYKRSALQSEIKGVKRANDPFASTDV